MARVRLAAACLLTALLAGCAATAPQSGPAPVSISVTKAYSDGNMADGCAASGGDTCSYLTVAIDNSRNGASFEASFGWTVQDGNGGLHTAIKQSGPDGISAGSTGQIVLEADTPMNYPASILQYESPGGHHLTSGVPPYSAIG